MFADALAAAKDADARRSGPRGSSAPENGSGFLENGASRSKEVKEDAEFDKESGEGYDRAKLRFGGLQLELLRELKSLGKRIVAVLVMGRPLIVDEVMALSDATLLAWYPGMEGGRAIAEAVFGELNPGGRLPIPSPRTRRSFPSTTRLRVRATRGATTSTWRALRAWPSATD
jgi:beta-glucosidase